MKMLKLLFIIYIGILVSVQVSAESEPAIYSNDNSYWVPEVEIRPEYPLDALKALTTGCVRVEFSINSDGKAVKPYKVVSIPEKAFERAGLNAIKKALFIPSSTNTNRIAVRSSIVYAFNIHSRENK